MAPGIQSFPPELCSLICQDPILDRLDLNSICFISHSFRNEAQKELSYKFPSLRGANSVKAWCLSLQRRPHLAIAIEGLVLRLPSAFRKEHIVRLTQALHMCVNLKELGVLFHECHQEPKYSSSTHMLNDHPFKLTKFFNGYFSQDDANFTAFLRSQPYLNSLKLHSGEMDFNFPFHLKTLSCGSPLALSLIEGSQLYYLTRLRLDFENSKKCEINVLERVLIKFRSHYPKRISSLAIFLKQEKSSFRKIIHLVGFWNLKIQHLEIHQFSPTRVRKYLLLPVIVRAIRVKTLLFRPPPGLPKMAGDNPNLCAYIELRTQTGRRKFAERLMMRDFPILTRLVLIVHGNDYEFRRDLHTGLITGENLITRDTQEWTLVD